MSDVVERIARKAEREFQARWRHYLKLRQQAGWPKEPQGAKTQDPKPNRKNLEQHIERLEEVVAELQQPDLAVDDVRGHERQLGADIDGLILEAGELGLSETEPGL